MSLDDLVGLFGAPPAGMATASNVVQGRMLTFSNVDGSNTVLVNGGILTNVPMLLTGAEVEYDSGDPVLLMIVGNTYMLLGKVAGVASAQFASASSATVGYLASTGNQAYTGPTVVTLASANITVPVWSNRMTFMGAAEVSYQNGGPSGGTPVDTDCTVTHIMNGSSSGSFLNWASAGRHNQKFEKFQSGVQTVTPGAVIVAQCTWTCNTTVPGVVNASQVSGTCLFSKQ